MNQLRTCTIIATLSFASVAFAQTPQQPSQQPSTSAQPSTSQAEGTAADRTRPGETPTRGATDSATQTTTTDPRPSTSPTEGTAADHTAPGQTGTTTGHSDDMGADDMGATGRTGKERLGGAGSEIVGKTVTTPDNAPIGEVVDVVFEATGQPAYVVISSEGKSAAVPYATASSMMSGDTIVVDRSRLQNAPKVSEGQWRDESESSSTWKEESSSYWDQG